MNVLIDAVGMRDGGGITHLAKMLPELARAQHGMQFFVLTGSEQWQRFGVEADRITWVDCGRAPVVSVLSRRRFYRRDLAGIVRDHETDVYYAVGGFLPKGVEGTCATICSPRNLMPFAKEECAKYSLLGKTRWRLRILRSNYIASMRRSDCVIVVSKYAQKVFEQSVGDLSSRAHLIYHGVDLPFDRTGAKGPIAGYEYVLYVSTISFYKYQIELLRAWKLLCKDPQFDAKLVLVGSNNPEYMPKFNAELAKLELGDRVVQLGNIGQDDLAGLYRGARMCVYCSGVECCPNIVLEMMRSGCAMALSNRGPMPEIARDAAEYFDPSNPAAVAETVLKVYNARDKARELGERAYKLSEAFTWSATTEKTLAAIEDTYTQGKRRLAGL